MSKRKSPGFTLIEMLTVLVIIGIVITIALPAFTNLMKSGGVNAAARQLSSTFSLARQYAITHRTTTRVVFTYDSTTGTAYTNMAPWYQSYAVLERSSLTNFTYLTKWEFLPIGVVFMSATPTIPVSIPSSLNTLPNELMAFPTNYNFLVFPLPPPSPVANTATLAYVEFGPTGAATQPSVGANSLTLSEGLMNAGSVTPTSRTPTNTLANFATINVDSIIGRIQVTRQ